MLLPNRERVQYHTLSKKGLSQGPRVGRRFKIEVVEKKRKLVDVL